MNEQDTDETTLHVANLRALADRLEKAAPPFGFTDEVRKLREAADHFTPRA